MLNKIAPEISDANHFEIRVGAQANNTAILKVDDAKVAQILNLRSCYSIKMI